MKGPHTLHWAPGLILEILWMVTDWDTSEWCPLTYSVQRTQSTWQGDNFEDILFWVGTQGIVDGQVPYCKKTVWQHDSNWNLNLHTSGLQPPHSLSQEPVLTGPARSYLNDRVLFRCEASQALPPVVYELLREEHIVASKTLTEVGQPANFSVQVTEESTGRYRCRVKHDKSPAPGSALYSNSLNFQVVIPVRGTYVIPDPNPPVLYEGQKLLLTCKVQHGTYLSYQWNLNRKEVSHRGSKLTIAQVTEQDAGDYSCSAKNDLENPRISYSNDIRVVVRALLSKPQLSFVVSREDSGYHADVTCQSSRGSPPVSFRLFLNGTVVASGAATSLSAHFYIPIRTGVNYGELQCRVQNDVQELSSNTVTLEVVPVGGEVRLRVDYLYDASSTVAAVLLQCAVAMGTFPEYAWFRNNTRLGEQGDSEVTANRGRSLLLTPAGAGNSGYYHCQVKDSFDNTSWTASRVTLIQVTGRITVSMEMIAMVLGCFLLLLLLGTTCFVVFRLHRFENYSQARCNDFELSVIPSGSDTPAALDDNLVRSVDPGGTIASGNFQHL